ncbi:MAG: class I SAM-dependent methyltransferase [Candidatus Binatia bacterium]|nr:class I SAM-dependent methyltransferase [Candidatus Binatia bacterium]
MAKFTTLTNDLYAYMSGHRSDRDPLLAKLVEETKGLGPISMMQIAPDQGALLSLLTRISGTRNAIEIGTFTGYSALSIARGLPADGTLLCCDSSEEWTAIARKYFELAGLTDKIELRIGPALETLDQMDRSEQFDLAFIDADKTNYSAYYEDLLPRLRPGGLMLFDNVLWGGSIIDVTNTQDGTKAIRALNDQVRDDPRLETVMLPVGDGLTIARKRHAEEMD